MSQTSASNERQIREANERQRRDRITDRVITEALMSSVDGRRWVWLRLADAQLFVEDADLDPYRMAYTKGTKQFALRLLRDVNRFAPEAYITMTRENTAVALELNPPTEEPSDD